MDLCVFLSNRCNLLCRYCTVLLNEGRPLFLTPDQVCHALDLYLEGARTEHERSLVYLGGEPLLRPDVIRDCVSEVRRRHPEVRQHLYTNGLLLTPELFRFLNRSGVDITISLDGKKTANDAFRVTAEPGGMPSWRAVMDRLRVLPIHALTANMVITPETSGALLENFEFLRRAGFHRIDFNPDTCRKERIPRWDPASVRRLGNSAAALAAHLESLLNAKKATFTCPHLTFFPHAASEPVETAWWHRLESVMLGADGAFYPSESLFIFPYETLGAFRFGDLKSGIDWERRSALEAEARDRVLDLCGPDQRFYNSPLNVYFYAKHAGRDPEPLLRGLISVWDAITAPLIEFERKYPGALATRGVVR